jgi:hypothetical protein
MQSLILNSCQHEQVHEIGEDFDQHGRMLRLVRCIGCGLLIREYLPTRTVFSARTNEGQK